MDGGPYQQLVKCKRKLLMCIKLISEDILCMIQKKIDDAPENEWQHDPFKQLPKKLLQSACVIRKSKGTRKHDKNGHTPTRHTIVKISCPPLRKRDLIVVI